MFHNQEAKICFLRVPKTGSTSMRRALMNHYGKMGAYGESPRGSHQLWFERNDRQKKLKGYLHIAAVRNPIEWLRSFYVILVNNRHLQTQFMTSGMERDDPYSEYIRKIKYTPCDWWAGMDETEQLIVYRLEDLPVFAAWLGIDVEHVNKTNAEKKPDFDLTPDDYQYLLERFKREYRYYPEEREKVHLAAAGGTADGVCALPDL